MDPRSDWIEDIVQNRTYEWSRIGQHRVETMLTPELPCQIAVGEKDREPVLYAAVGHNCTVHYWQWASVDQKSRKPLSRPRALDELWLFIDGAIERTRSEIVPKLAGWETATV